MSTFQGWMWSHIPLQAIHISSGQLHDVRPRWCVIILPELQNNTGRFIMFACPPCGERPASAALIGRLEESSTAPRRAAPGSSGAERRRSLAASEYLAGLGGQMMWSNTGGRLQLRGGLALKSGCRSRPCPLPCVVVVVEAQKPGGWPKSGE